MNGNSFKRSVLRGLVVLLAASCGTPTPVVVTATPSPAPPPTAVPSPTAAPSQRPPARAGTDIHQALPAGDPTRGERVAQRNDCVACHITYSVAPAFISAGGLPAIGERGAARLSDPAYTGQALTPEEYLIESILLPEAYVIEGNWLHPMDDFFDERLTAQDLADLLAWLHTFE